MAELKTKPTAEDVTRFLNLIEPEHKREDSKTILKSMQEITGYEPVLWGPAIIMNSLQPERLTHLTSGHRPESPDHLQNSSSLKG